MTSTILGLGLFPNPEFRHTIAAESTLVISLPVMARD